MEMEQGKGEKLGQWGVKITDQRPESTFSLLSDCLAPLSQLPILTRSARILQYQSKISTYIWHNTAKCITYETREYLLSTTPCLLATQVPPLSTYSTRPNHGSLLQCCNMNQKLGWYYTRDQRAPSITSQSPWQECCSTAWTSLQYISDLQNEESVLSTAQSQ